MTVAGTLAHFVSSLEPDNIPSDVCDKAARCVFYGFGIGLCGLPTSFASVASVAAAMAGEGSATLLRDGRSVPVASAILANAALLHGRCQEDTLGTAHFGAILLPTLFALAETRPGTSAEFLPALIAGYEVGGALERAMAKRSMAAAFRASPLYGTIASAAAVSRLLRLDERQTASALGHAAAFTGGTLQALSEGSDEWRYQIGIAGQAGLTAVDLALAGARAAEEAFEGEHGFAQAYGRVELAPTFGTDLGRDWAMTRVSFKPLPICAHNQTPALIGMRLRDRVAGRAISKVDVHIDPYLAPGMEHKGPFSRVSKTLMSTAFCVASALLRGSVDLRDLESYDDPEINRLIPAVNIVTDAMIPFPGCRMVISLADGGTIEHEELRSASDFDLDWEAIDTLLRGILTANAIDASTISEIRTLSHGLLRGSSDLSAVHRAFNMARETLDG